MIFELRIVEKVYNQLNEAVIYYELQQVGLGKNLLVEFKLAIENIVLNPFGHEKKYKQFRHTLLNRFPYLLIFEIEKQTIVVHQFFHAKRHPQKR